MLLGFSDAVEQLGTPTDGNEPIHPQLAAVLSQSAPRVLVHQSERPAAKPERKRLGRSLEQLRQTPSAKPADGGA